MNHTVWVISKARENGGEGGREGGREEGGREEGGREGESNEGKGLPVLSDQSVASSP